MTRDRKIHVNRDAVHASLTAIAADLSAMDAAFDELEARVALLRSQWDGDAQVAFDAAHKRWDASLRRLSSIHAAMNTAAASGVDRFDEFDRGSARAWQV